MDRIFSKMPQDRGDIQHRCQMPGIGIMNTRECVIGTVGNEVEGFISVHGSLE